MNLRIPMIAVALACLSSITTAVAPPPASYIKKAVFVRMHYDRSFYNYWHGVKGLSTASLDSKLTDYFQDARAGYRGNGNLHAIDLILLNDFVRSTGPMADYLDSAPQKGGDTRLLDTMHSRLRTGNVNKTVPSGVTHLVGRTINAVFVYGNYGGLQGAVEKVGGIGGITSADANLYISTSYGDFIRPDGTMEPLRETSRRIIVESLMHEFGHLIGGQHKTTPASEKPECPSGHPELMCQGVSPVEFRFGAKNYQRVQNVIKPALQRCNTAFSSQNSCNQFVTEMCASSTPDYSQIQYCIDFNQGVMCQDICTTAAKSARVVINSFGTILGTGVVDAGSVGP